MVKTRFAPSPTGYMHIGNLRTALYSYIITKHLGGTFMLRIEDTDQNREVEGAVDMIYKVINETGLLYDEGPDKPGDCGPYIQSQRLPIYKEYAHKLVQLGGAHYCFCQKNEEEENDEENTFGHVDPCRFLSLEEAAKRVEAGEPYVIRQTVPTEGVTGFDDEVYGHIDAENASLDEGVLLKSDGYPTYNFANVVDDHLMGITHVIRGNEYLSSTPKYNLMYKAFGWEPPVYIHCPPVMKDETHKLSKRNGDASYQDLVAKGYLKEAILNYIALLGWSPEGEEEIFSLQDLVEKFSVDRIQKSGAIFDINKLRWMNSVYLRAMSPEEYHELLKPYYAELITRPVDHLEVLSKAIQPRLEILSELNTFVDFINEPLPFDAELYKHKKMKTNPYNSLDALKWMIPAIEAFDHFEDQDAFVDIFVKTAKEHEVKNGRVMYPCTVALSNKKSTPGGITEIALVLGKEETLRRLHQAVTDLEAYVAANPQA